MRTEHLLTLQSSVDSVVWTKAGISLKYN